MVDDLPGDPPFTGARSGDVLNIGKEENYVDVDGVDDSLSGSTPREALDNFFSAALAYHRGTGFVGGCLFGNTAPETSDADPGNGRPGR